MKKKHGKSERDLFTEALEKEPDKRAAFLDEACGGDKDLKARIQQLLDARTVVIAVGGGGIPVVEKNGELRGVEAVVDKDLASERLAVDLNADILMFLTGVDHVMLNYHQSGEQPIDRMTIQEAIKYEREDQFAEGSMKPKIKAAIQFLESGGEIVIITSVEKHLDAMKGKTGTRIVHLI